MQIIEVDQNSEQWLEARKGKITGSKLRGIITKRGTARKIGFYELMAERIAIKEGYEDPMERGHRLEEEAVLTFQEMSGLQVDRVGFCISDTNPDIALSPDGLIKVDGKYKEAVEVKCLSSANHLKAHFEKRVPIDYEDQGIQYFIVNKDLEVLHFVFYDPRITAKPMFTIEMRRADNEEKIATYASYQLEVLNDINNMLEKLTF